VGVDETVNSLNAVDNVDDVNEESAASFPSPCGHCLTDLLKDMKIWHPGSPEGENGAIFYSTIFDPNPDGIYLAPREFRLCPVHHTYECPKKKEQDEDKRASHKGWSAEH
jgi:hypothetical protein